MKKTECRSFDVTLILQGLTLTFITSSTYNQVDNVMIISLYFLILSLLSRANVQAFLSDLISCLFLNNDQARVRDVKKIR